MHGDEVFQKNIEQEGRAILGVALALANRCYRKQFDIAVTLERTVWSWSGSSNSQTYVFGPEYRIYFALHDVFGCPLDETNSLFYYTEASPDARLAIGATYISAVEVLCNVVAHEVAHLFLFSNDENYGSQPHNDTWLEFMLYLRRYLVCIFVKDKRYGFAGINEDWHLAQRWVAHCINRDHAPLIPQKVRVAYGYIDELIDRLLRKKTDTSYKGLALLSVRLFHFRDRDAVS